MYFCFYLLKMQDSALRLHARRLDLCKRFSPASIIFESRFCSCDLFTVSSGDWGATGGWQLFTSSFSSLALDFLHFLRTATSLNSRSRSLPPSLGEVRQFWERMWGTAGPHHFSLWARERRRWQSDAQSLSLLMTAPFSIIITIIRKLGGQKVFTVNLPPPKER